MPRNLKAEVGSVPRDAPATQWLAEPLEQLVGHIGCDVLGYPALEKIAERFEFKEKMLAVPKDGRGTAGDAGRLLQFLGWIGLAASIAGVAVLIFRVTFRTDPFDKTVWQKHGIVFAIELRKLFHRDRPTLLHGGKDRIAKGAVLLGIRRVVVIKGDLEIRKILAVLL